MKALAVGLCAAMLAAPAWAQVKSADRPGGGIPPAAFKPLEERNDVVSWKVLSQVELVKAKDRYVPRFSGSVSALDKKEVKLQGFMMPLEMGDRQSHFILSATPQTCAFCLPGGPEQMVEVKMKTPVRYGFDPIIVIGRLAVLRDDPTGVYYRLTDAVPAK